MLLISVQRESVYIIVIISGNKPPVGKNVSHRPDGLLEIHFVNCYKTQVCVVLGPLTATLSRYSDLVMSL